MIASYIKTALAFLTAYKSKAIPLLIIAGFSLSAWLGSSYQKATCEAQIANLRNQYAESERDALRKAEQIRQDQEKKFLVQMDALKRDAVARSADGDRVRKQFNQLKSRSSSTLEQCNRRAGRCEQLLSEAYELAGEGEGLLRDRDARLKSLK